jgi:entericidin B
MTKAILTISIMLSVFAAVSTLSGCNTVAGAGKDIQGGGEAVQDAAKDVQKKM